MVFPLTITILTKILTSSIVFWVYWQHGDGTKWHVHSLVKNGKFLTKSYRIPTIKCMTGFYGRIRQVIHQMFIHSSDETLVINLLPDTAPNAINQSRKAVASRVPGSRKGTSTACVPDIGSSRETATKAKLIIHQPHWRAILEKAHLQIKTWPSNKAKLSWPIHRQRWTVHRSRSKVAQTDGQVYFQKERIQRATCPDRETLLRSYWSVMGPYRSLRCP